MSFLFFLFINLFFLKQKEFVSIRDLDKKRIKYNGEHSCLLLKCWGYFLQGQKPIHISKALNMTSKVSIKFLICLIFNLIIPKGKQM